MSRIAQSFMLVAALLLVACGRAAAPPEIAAPTGATPIATTTSASPRARVADLSAKRLLTGDHPSISGDGRLVAFESTEPALVRGDTNRASDMFVRDVDAGSSRRVSISSSGAQANRGSRRATLSGDGTMIAFASDATNLVGGDTNGGTDYFLHSLSDRITRRVSVGEDGRQLAQGIHGAVFATGGAAVAYRTGNRILLHHLNTTRVVAVAHDDADGKLTSHLSIDRGGRRVLFGRWVTQHVRLYVFDAVSGRTTTVADGDEQPLDLSDAAMLSPRGNYVLFVGGHVEGAQELFMTDLANDSTQRLAGTCTRPVAVHPRCFSAAAISDDERVVAFATQDGLSTQDRNEDWDVYARELDTGRTTLVSADANGRAGDVASVRPAISADGRIIAFTSAATTLAPGAAHYQRTPGCREVEGAPIACRVFRRDTHAGSTVGVSRAA